MEEAREALQGGGYARPLRLLLSAGLLGLLLSVAYLQLRRAPETAEVTRREQTRLVYVPACRGSLLDRAGRRLNYSEPCYSIVLRPELVRDPRDTRNRSVEKLEAVIAELAGAMGPDYYRSRPGREALARHLEQRPALPIVLWQEVDAATLARWSDLRREFPASELLLSWRRRYELPEVAPQMRGMTRRGASKLPEAPEGERYWNANAVELVGASGMEAALEPLLHGVGGSELLQTDVLAYRHELLANEPARRGEDCRLTISVPLQQAASAAFLRKGLSGAAVVLEMETGEVLAMHSSPSSPLGGKAEAGSQVNRALAGYYPPGSTIKPLLALYALEHGIATAEEPRVTCPGYYALGGSARLNCTHVHGPLAIRAAVAQSCNTYFCELARRFSGEQFDAFAQEFGFGERTGGALPGQEQQGIAFTPSWCRAHRRGNPAWNPGDAANAGIGQGAWIVTPMQLALAVNYVLTGRLLAPKFCREDETTVRRTRAWSEAARQLVVGGMADCAEFGTGRNAFAGRTVKFLAKTGTAETGRTRRPHAWIVAAAPAEAPRYLAVVVVEHGGAGGAVAAPIARELLESALKMEE